MTSSLFLTSKTVGSLTWTTVLDSSIEVWLTDLGESIDRSDGDSRALIDLRGLGLGRRRVVTAGDELGTVSVAVYCVGATKGSAGSPERIDPELDAQLRALGYIR